MTEVNIPFNFGQNGKLPALTDKEFFALLLENISPEDQHLRMLPALSSAYAVSDRITVIAYNFEPSSRLSDLYAFSDSKVTKLKSGGTFTTIKTLSSSPLKWAVVPWKDKIYYTRPDSPLERLGGNSSVAFQANLQGDKIAARYAVAAHDKLFLGNVVINGTTYSTTVKWSDLYNPEKFDVSESTEADQFQLSVDDLEITGLALHRNQVLIFTPKSIWTANYEGLPGVYSFSPLYGGVGCAYHESAIRVQDRVYFISASGVYKIDSFQLVEVGSEIWNSLRDDLVGQETVLAYSDELRKLLYWNVGTKTYVLNYEENRWAVYNFNFASALVSFPGLIKSTATIDEITVSYASLTSLAIDSGYNTQALTSGQMLARGGSAYQMGSGAVQTHSVQVKLPAGYFSSLWKEKELSEVKLVYTKQGNPVVTLTTEYQDSFSDTKSSQSANIETVAHLADEAVFKVRHTRVAKLLWITVSFTNSATDYVRQLVGLSLRFSDGEADR